MDMGDKGISIDIDGGSTTIGDIVGGDKVGRDKAGGNIVHVGSLDDDHTLVALQDALEQWQAQILAKIEVREDLDKDEKEEMKEAVMENAGKVLGEVQGQARPGRIERLLNTVSSMGDDILAVTVTTLADPFAGVGLVLKKIRERIKLEQAKEAKEEAA